MVRKRRGEETPLVSVIMPVYNGASLVGHALAGICGQTPAWEVCAVDDASTDESSVVLAAWAAREPRVRWWRHPERRNRCAARNTALRRARGELIAYCDQDDYWYPEHLETLVTFLLAHPEVDLVYSDVNLVVGFYQEGVWHPQENRGPVWCHPADMARLRQYNWINGLAVVHRRRCSEAFLWNERLWHAGPDSLAYLEDWEYWVTLSSRFTFAHCCRVTGEYHCHPAGFSAGVTVERIAQERAWLQAQFRDLEGYVARRES